MLLLSDEDIERALPVPECMVEVIDAIEQAELAHAQGRTLVWPRIAMPYRAEDAKRRNLVVLPAIVESMGAAVRTYSYGTFHPGPGPRPRPRKLQGITALYDFEDMGMSAVLEDGHLNNVRTAAPTGLAARYLCNPDASVLAIIGTGELASGQAAAVCAVRAIKQIRAYSRTPEHVEQFARDTANLLQTDVVPCAAGEDAVRGADVVITITNARAPVVERAWLSPGATVLSVATNEIDEATARDSRVVTTSIERLLDTTEAHEPFTTMVQEGRISAADIVELSRVVSGQAVGRESAEELVTFISTGSAHWDVAVPAVACRRARELGIGYEWP